MKNLKILTIIMLTILVSCKKKNPKPEAFDITKYSIVGKSSDEFPYVINFEAGGKATLTKSYRSSGIYTYTDGVLKLNFNDGEVTCTFVIENNKIKSYDGLMLMSTYDLVKIPAINQLAGKTFTGTYYRLLDKSVLHQNFFYSFAASENKVGVGYTVGTPLRSENYTIIGNIAAWVDIANSNDFELMVLINNKLVVGYEQSSPLTYYIGSFAQQ